MLGDFAIGALGQIHGTHAAAADQAKQTVRPTADSRRIRPVQGLLEKMLLGKQAMAFEQAFHISRHLRTALPQGLEPHRSLRWGYGERFVKIRAYRLPRTR